MVGFLIFYIITALIICATGVFLIISDGNKEAKRFIITAISSLFWFPILVVVSIFSGINTFRKKTKTIEEEIEEKLKEKLGE